MDSALQGNSFEQIMCIAARFIINSNFLIIFCGYEEVQLLMRGYEDLCGYEEMLI